MRPFVTLLALSTGLMGLPATTAQAAETWEQVVDITFPADPAMVSFSDTYAACRSGCARSHQATDIMGPKMTPLYATVDGRICRINEGVEDSYGRNLTICGDDGNEYRYLHINNDTPGTDDGAATLDQVYAPGIRSNARVARGQLVAFMGDSGNAESSGSHLHFDLYVPGVANPYGEERINPYPSLMAALARGDVADGTAVPGEASERLSGASRIETAIAVSRQVFTSADHVVLATSSSPHAALVGGPLASVLGGPVLITGSADLSPAVIAEIARLGATSVTLVGEVRALGEAVASSLPGIEVSVIDGGDRFATAALVAEQVWALTGAGDAEPVVEVVPETLTVPPLDFDPMVPGAGEPTLVFFEYGDREGVVGNLDGARLPGGLDRLYVSLAGVDPDEVERVSFHRGQDAGRGDRINSEGEWPYDLGGSGWGEEIQGTSPWWQGAGDEALTASVHLRNGDRFEVTANFHVGNGTAGGGSGQPQPRRAIVALGEHGDPSREWPDALAASWYGAVRRLPVLLTRTDAMPAPTSAAMANVVDVVVAGGGAAVSDAQVAAIEMMTGATALRLRGADRYETAAAIASDLVGRRLVDDSTVFVATGTNWPDAVAAGSAVAEAGGLLLLVDGAAGESASARAAFTGYAATLDRVMVLGGTAAVADTVVARVAYWSL